MTAEGGEPPAEGGEKKGKTKPPAWMFNDQGVAYAPWMVDAFDPEVRRALPAVLFFLSYATLYEALGVSHAMVSYNSVLRKNLSQYWDLTIMSYNTVHDNSIIHNINT